MEQKLDIQHLNDKNDYHNHESYLNTRQSQREVLDKSDKVPMTCQMFKCIPSQSTNPFNGQTKYYLKKYINFFDKFTLYKGLNMLLEV